MYQRIGTNASIRNSTHQFSSGTALLTDIKVAEANSPPTIGGRITWTKKLILTLLVLLQVCFISCLWLLQLGGGLNTNISEVTVLNGGVEDDIGNANALDSVPRPAAWQRVRGVNFITKTAALTITERAIAMGETSLRNDTSLTMKYRQSGNANNFRRDFYLKLNRLNTTIEVRNGTELLTKLDNGTLWCFREGSIDEKSYLPNDTELPQEEDAHCKCRAGWHGRDCGQPEVMWRALLNTKSRFRLQKPFKAHTFHRLVYLLEGNFFNLDLLDLQIKLIADVVDFFVIFVKPAQNDLKSLERRLREILPINNYLLFQCDEQLSLRAGNCTANQAYTYFRQRMQRHQLRLQPLKPTDLLLYTDDRVLPSRQALQFLKYYAMDVRNVPFRLKYVVYGFYWQHPVQTKLSGIISSLVHVDNHVVGSGSDLSHLIRDNFTENTRRPSFIIGDLNHFGGWFCIYCQQPDEIIAELHAEANYVRQVQFPTAIRNRNIDVAYLHNLIATGIYVDGKTQLLRNRRYSDKYYAPAQAEADAGKFGNLLVNIYESFDDDMEYNYH